MVAAEVTIPESLEKMSLMPFMRILESIDHFLLCGLLQPDV